MVVKRLLGCFFHMLVTYKFEHSTELGQLILPKIELISNDVKIIN